MSKALQTQAARAVSQTKASALAISRFEIGREDGLHSLMPEPLALLAEELPDDVLRLTEDELEARTPITRQDRRIRISFWQEHAKSVMGFSKMNLDRVLLHTGIPTWQIYDMKLRENPSLVAWLLTPPAGYKLQVEELMERGFRQVSQIFDLPIMDKKGRVNTGLVKLQLEAFKSLDQRKHGSYTQKTVQMQFNGGEIPAGSTALDHEAIDEKLRALEQEVECSPLAESSHGTDES